MLLRQTANEAHQQGELPSGTDPDQLAFELGTMLAGTNIIAVLHSDDGVIERARRMIQERLGQGLRSRR